MFPFHGQRSLAGYSSWGRIELDKNERLTLSHFLRGFPGSSGSKESTCNVGDPGLIPGSGRSPGERKWQTTLVFLPGKSHGPVEPGRLQSMGSQRVVHN